MIQTEIWTKLTFIGFHHWKGAEGKVAYLRHNHRHLFYVKAGKAVKDLDREIEFHTLQEELDNYIREKYERKSVESSCEMIATDLLEKFDLSFCEVSEDNECGASVRRV